MIFDYFKKEFDTEKLSVYTFPLCNTFMDDLQIVLIPQIVSPVDITAIILLSWYFRLVGKG